MSHSIPAVLVFSGLDPSGGAGMQADIEALASHGCHACPVITALTVQDTNDVLNKQSVAAELIYEQAMAILQDVTISAIKVGLLDNIETIRIISQIANELPHVPLIVDPVLASGNNTQLNDDAIHQAIKQLLLPQTTVLTPNSIEARTLAQGADTLDACAMALLDEGCEFVLVTGTHEPGEKVCNSLYSNHRKLEQFHWQRLTGEYHGSGCTLASSIAGLLAQGNEPMTAIHEAQEYTWQCLQKAYAIGQGQLIPNRFFWATS